MPLTLEEARNLINERLRVSDTESVGEERSLDLSGLNLTNDDIDVIAPLFKKLDLLGAVIHVDLSNNNITTPGAHTLAGLISLAHLKSLNLSGNNIFPKGALFVAEALASNNTVTSVDFSSNQIDYAAAQALVKMLSANTSLLAIDLSDNKMGPLGAIPLAKALQANATLTSIDLSNNEIRSERGEDLARAVAEALNVNRTLTSIGLNGNRIGDQGAEALAAALKVNETLTSIGLNGTKIGDKGVEALAAALKVNRTLTSIDLRENQITDEGAKALAEVAVNEPARIISLDGNSGISMFAVHEMDGHAQDLAGQDAALHNSDGAA